MEFGVSIYLSTYLAIYLSTYHYLITYLPIYLSIYVYDYMCIYIYIYYMDIYVNLLASDSILTCGMLLCRDHGRIAEKMAGDILEANQKIKASSDTRRRGSSLDGKFNSMWAPQTL